MNEFPGRRLGIALALALPVFAAAGIGVFLVTRDVGALWIGIGAAVLVPLAAVTLFFVREGKLDT